MPQSLGDCLLNSYGEPAAERKQQPSPAFRSMGLSPGPQLRDGRLRGAGCLTQPRVDKLENRDPEVTLDLQMKAIFAANANARREFQGLIKKWSTAPRARR